MLLLAGIAARGSLRAACDEVGIPYRTAWDMLREIEKVVGGPLVRLERGRGASLTDDGASVLRADEQARGRLSRELESLSFEIGARGVGENGPAPPVLRVAASHDPALAALRDALPAAAGARLSIEFCGSLDALTRFKAGEVDLAGFHVVPGDAAMARPYLRILKAVRGRLIRFVDREQGLIVAPGNPRRIRSLADVARRRLRFVNRQPGSGTRALVEVQLAKEGVEGSALPGYERVEFTHAAVAATIASDAADAGVGVAAAAAEYGLGFIPLVRERYYLAVRESPLNSPGVVALRESLKGAVFKELAGQMAGYDPAHSGELEPATRRTPARRPLRK
jgi:putative molybdopterin biosynthesis protein